MGQIFTHTCWLWLLGHFTVKQHPPSNLLFDCRMEDGSMVFCLSGIVTELSKQILLNLAYVHKCISCIAAEPQGKKVPGAESRALAWAWISAPPNSHSVYSVGWWLDSEANKGQKWICISYVLGPKSLQSFSSLNILLMMAAISPSHSLH